MIYIKPDFYDKFKCIASKCTDSCCIGWEIDIDEKSLNRYENYKGIFAEKLKENIVSENGCACFKLKGEDEHCPFLNKENLCDMIINCGEDMLCDICREHPRFYEWYDNYTDMGLGLCCEEAVRLLFESKEPLKFIYEDDGKTKIDDEAEELLLTRQNIFNILKNTEKNFSQKIVEVISYAKHTEKNFFEENENTEESFKTEDIKKEILKISNEWEPFDENFSVMIKNIEENIDLISEKERDFDKYMSKNPYRYEKLFVYTVFRYYMKCMYDGSISGKISFALIYVWLVKITDILIFMKKGELSEKDSINSVKYWSKQIDYSEENVDFLLDETVYNEKLSCENLKKLF